MKKFIAKKVCFAAAVSVLAALVAGCGPSREELETEAKNIAIKEYAMSLSPDVRFSQLFLVNIEGNEKYSAVEKYGDKSLVPGGVLFFGYNVAKEPEQIKSFVESIHQFYSDQDNIPPYTAIDQEGGDVNRLRKINSRFPEQKTVALEYSQEEAGELYDLQAKQMSLLGFNMNLAPVIEVENNDNSAFLDTRTFGSLEKVLLYGKSQVEGFEKNKIGCVVKHFPGNSATDPHVGLPVIRFDSLQLEEMLEPFAKLLPFSSAMLMSHAVAVPADCPEEEKEKYNVPADLSSYWVTDVVRKKMGYEGLVISDDIFMGALAQNGYPPQKAVTAAIDAGVDVIMLSEKRFGKVLELLIQKAQEDDVFNEKINAAVERVLKYKVKCGLLQFVPVESKDKTLKYKVETAQRNRNFDQIHFDSLKERGQNLVKYHGQKGQTE